MEDLVVVALDVIGVDYVVGTGGNQGAQLRVLVQRPLLSLSSPSWARQCDLNNIQALCHSLDSRLSGSQVLLERVSDRQHLRLYHQHLVLEAVYVGNGTYSNVLLVAVKHLPAGALASDGLGPPGAGY